MCNQLRDEFLNDCQVTCLKWYFFSVENEKILRNFQNMNTCRVQLAIHVKQLIVYTKTILCCIIFC